MGDKQRKVEEKVYYRFYIYVLRLLDDNISVNSSQAVGREKPNGAQLGGRDSH